MTAFANYFQSNRELEIETDEAVANGHRLVLDFRQVTHDLGFVFKQGKNGLELEVEREESYTFPFLKLPLESPLFRFNSIVFTNIDENTIIYTGRKENKIRIANGITVKSTIIGSSGIAPPKSVLDVGESIVEPLLTLRVPPLSPINVIDYSQFTPLRVTSSDLGGGTLPTGGVTSTIVELLTGALSPLPFHYTGDSGSSSFGNTSPRPTAVDDVNATLVNLFSVRNGGFGSSFAGGTNVRPLTVLKQGAAAVGSAVKSIFNRNSSAPLEGDDYINRIPDEFRQYVASSEALGRNDLQLGAGNLFRQFLDSISKSVSDRGFRYQQLLGAAPSLFAIMMGLTGADSYDFAGLWGSAIVLDPPDIVFGSQGENAFPHTLDTLNFGSVKSDLHVTLLQAPTLIGQSGSVFGGVGEPVAIVTPFDPTGIDWSTFQTSDIGSLLAAIFGLNASGINNTFDDAADDWQDGKIVNSIFSVDKGLAIDGGVVFATGIETIIGGAGKTTIHFSDDWGAAPTLNGRVVGEDVVLDYSDIAPDLLPAALKGGVSVENTFEYIFDWLGIAEGNPFSFEDSEKARAASSDLADFVAKFEAKHGQASLVSGDREFNITEFFHALGSPVLATVGDVGELGGALVGVTNVTDVIGTHGPDTLGGNSANNILVGFGGLDTVDGAGGERDVFSYLPIGENGSLSTNAPSAAVTFNFAGDKSRFWDGGGKDEFEAAGFQNTTFTTSGASAVSLAAYSPPGSAFDTSGTLSNIEGYAGGTGNDLFLGGPSRFDGTVTVDTPGDANVAEVVTLTLNGDASFRLTYNGASSPPIPPDADAGVIESAINDLMYPDTTAVFGTDDGVTVSSSMSNVWSVTFKQTGERSLLRMEDADGQSYIVTKDWGDDLIIDQGGTNTLDFSYHSGEISIAILNALRDTANDQAGSIAISTANNNVDQTLTMNATDGEFLLKLGDQVTGPIEFVTDPNALASSITTELEQLKLADNSQNGIPVTVSVDCSSQCQITFTGAAASANIPELNAVVLRRRLDAYHGR